MSSIRTMDSARPGPAPDSGPAASAPSADSDTSSRPPGAARAAARSASFSAAQTQSTSARPATADNPATSPPPPRRLVSLPSSPRLNDTGPRLDAISTRPAGSALMEGRLGHLSPAAGAGSAVMNSFAAIGYGCEHNFITLIQRGGGIRPCEAPATTVTGGLLAGLRPAAPLSAVLVQGGDPLEPPAPAGVLAGLRPAAPLSAVLVQGGDPRKPPAPAGVCCTAAGPALAGPRCGRCQVRPAAVGRRDR